MKKGDILEFSRANGLFYHYGMYIGDNKVIHRDKSRRGSIFVTDLDDMIGGMRIVSPRFPRVPTDIAIARAHDMMEAYEYNFLTNNCEHFVNFVRYDRPYSKQVRRIWAFGLYIMFIVLGRQKLNNSEM